MFAFFLSLIYLLKIIFVLIKTVKICLDLFIFFNLVNKQTNLLIFSIIIILKINFIYKPNSLCNLCKICLKIW